MARGIRKTRTGIVVSNKMDRTVVVSIERFMKHPVYGKYLKRRAKVMAHDKDNDCKVGDKVLIVEARPLSRLKRWRIAKILERAQ
ncbi:MAG: 30S ribosomal protein S17 [Deltaproteobacteria bacterium]|nr:30S ribosomal protein S17 [Deltaproteobacteria bacterium]